jgi:hypothetical protein
MCLQPKFMILWDWNFDIGQMWQANVLVGPYQVVIVG